MNKTYKLLSGIALVSAVFFTSCELYNPAEPIPAYVHIQQFTLTTDYPTEGTNSHKITDAWVYVDDQTIGCFEMPVTFPVLAEGVHKIKIIPGIKVNGISANRGQYPFYTAYEQTVDFKVGTTINLSPTTTYKSTTSFDLLEDFEGASYFSITTNSDTTLQTTTNVADVFEMTYSGIAYADQTRPFFECASIPLTSVLPHGGAPVFLEMNYKCNYQFTVSVIASGASSTSQFAAINVNPSDTWNKMYVYLTPTVSGTSSANTYKMVFGMHNVTNADSAVMLLDNIKVIH